MFFLCYIFLLKDAEKRGIRNSNPLTDLWPDPETVLSWWQHRDIYVMQDTLRYIQRLRPPCGVAENVVAMGQCCSAGSKSALQVFQEQLEGHGYMVVVKQLCLSTFHQCVRRRLVMDLLRMSHPP